MKPSPHGDASRGRRGGRDEFNPPVSRLRIGLFAALFGLLAGLVHWLGAPSEVVGVLALCAALYFVVMLLPDRIRRLLAWDLKLW